MSEGMLVSETFPLVCDLIISEYDECRGMIESGLCRNKSQKLPRVLLDRSFVSRK